MRISHIELPSVRYMIKRVSDFMEMTAHNTGRTKNRLVLGYYFNALLYGCTPAEYVLYRFYDMNRSGKKRFVTSVPQRKYERTHSDPNVVELLTDKEKTLITFPEFMCRQWCGVNHNNEDGDYDRFVQNQSRGIMKPIGNYGGHGIEMVSLQGMTGAQLKDLCHKNNAVIEELIVQHPAMSELNPSSVNTIRVMTKDGAIIGAALRIGVGSSFVDNASSGGIYAEVDVDSGVALCRAINGMGDVFTLHPDTGVAIPGFKIPFWSECTEMVRTAAKKIPDVSLVGWDVAVTSKGPTLVEANVDPMLELVQAPCGHGLANRLLGK